ncbi:hypothetical protein Sjap_015595 [Stephania japonica]|uniref:BED-type domain-containing protein n=1 Tax=Stephania japonica TaxID=461633 RepID=A0AAP0NRI3_9MAGN
MGRFKVRKDDITWDHCTMVEPPNKTYLKCNYCGEKFHGGVYRMKHHLARTRKDAKLCSKVPDNVTALFDKMLKDKENEKAKQNDEMFDLGGNDEDNFIDVNAPRPPKRDHVGGGSVGNRGGNIDKIFSKKANQTTLNEHWKKEEREKAIRKIARFFYCNNIAFNVANDFFFKDMVQCLTKFGPRFKPPSYHELRVPLLKKEVAYVNDIMQDFRDK